MGKHARRCGILESYDRSHGEVCAAPDVVEAGHDLLVLGLHHAVDHNVHAAAGVVLPEHSVALLEAQQPVGGRWGASACAAVHKSLPPPQQKAN